jgi:hypothetical protein
MPMGEPIQMLWIGPRLSTLERLSMASFLANGHPVHLFAYETIEGVPAGVEIHDAREVMPADSVFTYADGFGKGSPAAFANLFRYKLLLDRGGYWSDTDTVCLKPFDFTGEYVIGAERLPTHAVKDGKTARLAIGVLKVPPNSAVMQECYAIAKEANRRDVRWGETGPDLVTRAFARHGLVSRALAPDVFYPLEWWNARELVMKPLDVPPQSYAIHLWNQLWSHKRLDKDGTYPADCAYETLKRRYGV